MYQVDRTLVTKVLNFILIFSIIIALLGAVRDFRNIANGSSVDLRNRVVGARLLIRDLDPYYFKWQPGDPEILLDPYTSPDSSVSRTTLPPTGLALYIPFANLSYPQQKSIWFALQWLALLTSLGLLIGDKSHLQRGKFLLIVTLLLFAGGRFWRVHVSLGQIYVFYVFFIAAAYRLLQQKLKWGNEIAGLLIGLAASIRFPLLVMVLPMLIFRQFRLLTATLLSFFIWLTLSVLAFGQTTWLNYFSAMKVIAGFFSGTNDVGGTQASQASQVLSNVVFPQTVEGVSWENNQSAPVDTTPVDTSIPLLLNDFLHIHISIGYLIAAVCIALLSYSFIIIWLYKRTRNQFRFPTLDQVFIFGTLMVVIVELLIPTPRYPYYNIQLLIPLVLILKNANFTDFKTIYLTSLLFFGFLLSNRLFDWLPGEVLIGQFLSIFILFWMSLVCPASLKG